ncbi:MAG: glycosyl transferase family 1 [Robiginitomaculum sp.]|nr:MAG: glycosyl transferase family 1 [Robiginitomaculum sp.]
MNLPTKMRVEKAEKILDIAICYSRLPFPMMRGDQLTVAHLISFLSARGHRVFLYTVDCDGKMERDQEEWLMDACEEVHLFKVPKFTRMKNAFFGLFRGCPLQVSMFHNADLNRMVKKSAVSGKFDILYCYYLRSAPAASEIFSPNKTTKFSGRRTAAFLAMQLSQTLNTRRIFENSENIFKKAIYFLEWQLLRRYETKIGNLFSKVVLIGPKDVEAIQLTCKELGRPEIYNWIYGAHGTDVHGFRVADDAEVVANRIVFSGSMLYQPNVQAVLWFMKHCWGDIQVAVPGVELIIVGRDPVPEIKSLGSLPQVEVTGTVPDVGTYIRSASICINPMLAAGGMQNKLIEYMACGKAVVATSVANEGINALDCDSIFIANSADEFVKNVVLLLNDKALVRKCGEAAREFVLENWTWESHFRKLEQEYYKALEN